MASGGFSGGGPDFYNTTGFGSRSITTTTANTNTNNIMNMNNNNNNNPSQQQPLYRSQLPAIYLDQTSQISNRAAPNFMGKRTLSEFQLQHQHQQHQQQQQHHQNPALANLFLRHVKPRMYQNISSPISPLSPIDFPTPEIPSLLSQQQQQRFGIPLLQQLRPQPIGMGPTIQQVTNQTHSGIPYMNSVQQSRVQQQDSEKKMMNQLLELEKQLLDDNDEDEGDAVSVVTNTNSEWSETIQNLISVSSSSSPKQISLSPTSSSSSSSSSSTVASPVSSCSKQTLMEAASAISEGKTDVANEILTRVGQVSNPIGNSEQRLMEYLLLALKSRGNSFENPSLLTELYTKEHVASTQLLYDISPCFKLGFMAANLAILEATLDQPSSNKFHVVDFDIGQGGQYMNLLHALSGHPNGKAALVKITAVADNEGDERLRCVGDVLCKVAEKVGVSLEFNVVVITHKLGDLSRDSLGCDPDEPLAVNFAFKLYRMPDESVSTENPRDELLRRVKGLSPRVVTLVEQEMNTNTAPFMGRVGEVCSFYGALFDSIESTVARDNSDRVKVEEGLGRKLANSVACEGRERVERCEVFGKWRARMGMAGFELKQLSQNVAESMRIRLSSRTRVNPGFTVKEENGGVCFGWMGRTLTVASAWR